ncbi:hypothetical protein RJT34_23374 [Clitoria ternatea]|uniref:Uncharacterized protein n=1 Tax=Clitoria ternatea TaxID=43366 RepID=A0AAN9FNR3_CLITE
MFRPEQPMIDKEDRGIGSGLGSLHLERLNTTLASLTEVNAANSKSFKGNGDKVVNALEIFGHPNFDSYLFLETRIFCGGEMVPPCTFLIGHVKVLAH